MNDDGGRAQAALHHYFGYTSFRTGQHSIVNAILAGRDSLAVMPTGAGKSVCYQIPSLLLPGVTIVISPLLSLMRDQVDALDAAGIAAAFLNSTQTIAEQHTVLHAACDNAYDLLYVAPERLNAPLFLEAAERMKIAIVAVDEAHCISQWGQDFRPAYLDISAFITRLAARPVVAAFTATATPKVESDIIRILGLHEPQVVVTGFDRPNLFLDVQRMTTAEKLQWISSYVAKHRAESGIIYCSTRKESDAMAAHLIGQGIAAACYHAGLSHEERLEAQRAFVNDDIQVVVATNAFGMGIDKSNVRYVIHHNMPESIESYYQEAGRAGRDGEDSRCTLLWNESDIVLRRRLLEFGSMNDHMSVQESEQIRMTRSRLLQSMIGYCRTTDCLHRYILRYFGQRSGESTTDNTAMPQHRTSASPTCSCGHCANCEGNVTSEDVTSIAVAIGKCVSEVRQRFGMTMIVRILKGSQAQQIMQMGLNNTASFGVLRGTSEALIRDVINQMSVDDLLAVTPGRMPIIVFASKASSMVAPDFHYEIKHLMRTQRNSSRRQTTVARQDSSMQDGDDNPADEALFQRLRTVRKDIATRIAKPPYIVFSDRSLRDMVRLRPTDKASMLQVHGVGEHKWDSYGEQFIEAINQA